MRFDDRLRTVLDQPAANAHDRAVRWRQLVDLLARSGEAIDSPHARTALDLVRKDAVKIDEALRAAAARAVAALTLPFELVAVFALDSLKVSAPVLAAAKLEPAQWLRIIEDADEETQQFIQALHPDTGSPAAAPTAPEPDAAPVETPATPTISEVLARIERLHEARRQSEQAPAQTTVVPSSRPVPAAPQPAEEGLFRWESSPAGEFAWVEGVPRGALIGRPIVDPAQPRENGGEEIARAFALRAPFRNVAVTLGEETALDGEWELSGLPAFEPVSGRFAGYRGVARRASRRAGAPAAPHPDSLRELVHEIKTPLNAIMGFAEIIEGQMFGPAGAPYRERAATIVSQSHLLLSAIDDLDFAAKLQSRLGSSEGEANLAAVLESVGPQLHERAESVGVRLRTLVDPQTPICAVDGALIERLLHRLVGALIDCASKGETLELSASQSSERCSIALDRPAALHGLGERELLDPALAIGGGQEAGVTLGFSLRLVRGIAQLAGGDLKVGSRRLILLFARAGLRPPVQRRYRSVAGQGL